jgi:hypothetical protein
LQEKIGEKEEEIGVQQKKIDEVIGSRDMEKKMKELQER